MTREITLTKGLVALVDDDNLDWLNQWNWSVSQGYAVRGAFTSEKRSGYGIGMHRVVAGAAPSEVVDHIDRNPLNNQRANLRICSQRDNSRNRKGWLTGKSKFKGVVFDKERGIWVAHICVNRRTVFLGRFEREADAANQYDAAALHAFRDFAHCNSVGPPAALADDLVARLDAALSGKWKSIVRMSREDREAALARALRGEDYRFIAEDYGISRSAVGGIVFRHKHPRCSSAEAEAAHQTIRTAEREPAP